MYDNHFPYYDQDYVGAAIVSKYNSPTVFLGHPGIYDAYSFITKGTMLLGYSTGRIGTVNGRYVIQIQINYSPYAYGYVYSDECDISKSTKTYGRESVQSIINDLIMYNQKIVFNSLVSAHLIKTMEARGVQVPHKYKVLVSALQVHAQQRDERLKENEWLTGRQVGIPKGVSSYQSDLESIMNESVSLNGIGALVTISVTTVIIVSVVATLLVTTLLYMAFFQSRKEALSDFKKSEEYLQVLAGLDEESKKIVEEEVSRALNYGYKIGSNSKFKTYAVIAACAGVFLIAKPLIKSFKSEHNDG